MCCVKLNHHKAMEKYHVAVVSKKKRANGSEADMLVFTSCANGDGETYNIFELLYEKLKVKGKVFDPLHSFHPDN